MSNVGRITGVFTTPASGTTVIPVDDPFAIHLWWSRVTADDTIQADQQFGHGFGIGSTRDCGMTAGEDGVNQNQRDGRSGNCILITDPAGTSDVVLAQAANMNATNVTIDYNTFSAGYRIHYEIWYGTDGSAEMRDVQASSSPLSDLTMSTPDMVLGWTLGQAHPASSVHGYQAFGVAVDNGGIDQWCQFTYMGDGDTDAVGSSLIDGEFLGQVDVDFTAWSMQITAIGSNGCTWNGSNGDDIILLFLDFGGDNVAVGTFAKSTASAPVTQQMPDFGFVPDGYSLATCNFDLQTRNTDRIVVNSFGAYSEEDGAGHSALSVGTPQSNSDRASQSHSSEVLQGSVALQASGIEWSATPDAITDQTPSFELNPNTTGGSDDVIIGYYGHEDQFIGGETATGAPELPAITAAGVAQITMPATGAPSLPAVTASGVATVTRHATGAPILAAIIAAGAAEVINTASGAADLPAIEAAGTAQVIKTASGAPILPAIETSGTAGVARNATGAPTLPIVTAAGVAQVTRHATGALDLPAIETSGVAEIINAASGALDLPAIEAAGVAQVIKTATGAPDLPSIEASGVAQITKLATGAPDLPAIEAAGVADVEGTLLADGAPVLPAIEAAGVAQVIKTATGAPVLPAIEAAGVAEVNNLASGAPDLPAITAAGTATVTRHATGAPDLPAIEASGAAQLTKLATGAPVLPAIESAGVARMDRTATGAPVLPAIETAGQATIIGQVTATGAPELPAITAAGVATVTRHATGAPDLPAITAAGVAEVNNLASGAPDLPAIEAAGVAQVTKLATGAPDLPAITAAGVAQVTKLATGAPTLPAIEAAGVASIVGQITATGAPELPAITAAGAATVTRHATGAPILPAIIAAGVADSGAITAQRVGGGHGGYIPRVRPFKREIPEETTYDAVELALLAVAAIEESDL